MTDTERLEKIRQEVAQALDALAPEDRDLDHTTKWAKDFETAEDLGRWLRWHKVSDGSFKQALREYETYKVTGTVKRFEVRRGGGGRRYVVVRGNRRWRKREDAEGAKTVAQEGDLAPIPEEHGEPMPNLDDPEVARRLGQVYRLLIERGREAGDGDDGQDTEGPND